MATLKQIPHGSGESVPWYLRLLAQQEQVLIQQQRLIDHLTEENRRLTIRGRSEDLLLARLDRFIQEFIGTVSQGVPVRTCRECKKSFQPLTKGGKVCINCKKVIFHTRALGWRKKKKGRPEVANA